MVNVLGRKRIFHSLRGDRRPTLKLVFGLYYLNYSTFVLRNAQTIIVNLGTALFGIFFIFKSVIYVYKLAN